MKNHKPPVLAGFQIEKNCCYFFANRILLIMQFLEFCLNIIAIPGHDVLETNSFKTGHDSITCACPSLSHICLA